MSRRLFIAVLVGVPLVLLAAAPAPSVDDLIRLGNTAFADNDFAAAIKYYDRAEGYATDPGLVAFNKATALYQLALATAPARRVASFQQAEKFYRCAAEGAVDRRRLRSQFGLGNSILQGRPKDASALKEAIDSYRDCLHNPAIDEGTGIDVRHNLEVARLFLLQAQSKPSRPEEEPKNTDSGKKPDPPEQDPDRQKPMGGDPGMKDSGTPKPSDQSAEVKDGDKAHETEKTTAGKGSKQTLADATQAPPLTAEAAEAQLKEAIERIREEQRGHRLRSLQTPSGTVKDW